MSGQVDARQPVVVICVTILCAMFIGGLVVLLALGRDASTLTQIVNTVLNSSGLIAGLGAVFYSQKAAKQTNGSLDKRIQDNVHAVLSQREVNSDGGQVLQRPRVNRHSGPSNDDRQP